MSKDVSLIEAIQKLTAAVEANTAAVMQSVGTPAQVPAERNLGPFTPADGAQAKDLGPPYAPDYATDVKPDLLKLIGKDREKAGKVLAAFGAKKGDQVPACMKSPEKTAFATILIIATVLATALLPLAAHAGQAGQNKPSPFAKIDKDGDGFVSEDEFNSLIAPNARPPSLRLASR